jgi:hypothetical protein
VERRFLFPGVAALLAAAAAFAPTACTTKQPEESTYFERNIGPILQTSCVRTNTGAGCHVVDAKGNSLGNLDVSSYAGVAKRRDLLVEYGPYGQPAFLIKNVDPFQVQLQTFDGKKVTVSTDIKHVGGSILDPTGTAYTTLRRWIQNGATENNTGLPPQNVERLPCNEYIPARPDFDVTKDPPRPDFGNFKDNVNPVITTPTDQTQDVAASCAAGNCHGTIANSLYLTCGHTPEQIRWNYLAAEEYLGQTPELSELLRRPLSPAQGGAYHEGGVIFQSAGDTGYQRLQGWAQQHGPPVVDTSNSGFNFFSAKVQPMLVKKGCTMIQCHSASMFHDYRLRGGSSGSFSLSATRKNYELSLAQMNIESDDPNASRLVRKNLYRPEVCSNTFLGCDTPNGITHRGGPLLEDFGDQTASQKACDDLKLDFDNGDIDKLPAYCVIGEWLKRERARANVGHVSGIVYVKRPIGSVKRAQDFDVYSPGADLRLATAAMVGTKVTVTADASLTDKCGLSVASADIRRPQVSWDATKIAFAARSSAGEPLSVYEMNADGSACAKHAMINTPLGNPANGLLVHNFDPVYAPPEGGFSRIVFASTRGNLKPDAYGYDGPQRTPADPTKPNSNLYVLDAPDKIRQLTYLLNMERQPSFMSDGRVIFSAEKRAPQFYQVALRRINVDGGDYHPLYAQRGSIGYPEATQVVELCDKNFAMIQSDPKTPHGGGLLAVFNRSIGVDFRSTNPADYLIDPGVLDPAQLQSPDPQFFLHSLRPPDGASSGRPGEPTDGVYASPAALPNGRMLVSFGPAADAGAFGGDYDVWVMNPITGFKEKIIGDATGAEVDAVAVYPRFVRPVFKSSLDEPNGHTIIYDGKPEAELYILDFRVLASLLFQNTPTGRLVDPDIDHVDVYEDMPPTPDIDSFDKGGSNVVSDPFGRVYVKRRLLGAAVLETDGSVKFNVPGGLPIVLKLPDTKLSRERNLPRVQREAMEFAPGEYAHQSFTEPFFGSLCGQCHGAVSGRPVDVALQPDFITRASATIARSKPPYVMNKAPGDRAQPEGPPATP